MLCKLLSGLLAYNRVECLQKEMDHLISRFYARKEVNVKHDDSFGAGGGGGYDCERCDEITQKKTGKPVSVRTWS